MSEESVRYATIPMLRSMLDRRELTVTELAETVHALIDRHGPPLNAVARLTPDRAAATVVDAVRLMEEGRATVLTGIPWAPKDLLATRGIPTEWGAPPFRGQVFDYDAAVVERLDAVGAPMVAKLAMVEMAGAGLYRFADASIDGPCRNPWDLTRWSGGSSSGSAAAVSAGLVPFSIGSETGGSLVIPAAFCGVTAIRPSLGAVSRFGALQLCATLDKLGPVARSAEDCESVLLAIAGADERDPFEGTLAPVSEGRVVRIGVLEQESEDAAVNLAFADAVSVLRDLGCRQAEVALPSIDLRSLHDRLFASETLAALGPFIDSPDVQELIDDAQIEALLAYRSRTPDDYQAALRDREAAAAQIRALFADVDVLVAPTVLTEAVAIDQDLLEYRKVRRGGNMFLGSIAGVPELTMPMGFGSSGLPVGVSFIGDRWQDLSILDLGRRYQEASAWHLATPPVLEAA